MAEFIVAVDHVIYYAVKAEDEATAIDLVLEDQGSRSLPRRAILRSSSMNAATRGATSNPKQLSHGSSQHCRLRNPPGLPTQRLFFPFVSSLPAIGHRPNSRPTVSARLPMASRVNPRWSGGSGDVFTPVRFGRVGVSTHRPPLDHP
jgi:hypothetical protein